MIFPNVEDAHNIFDLRDMAKRRLPKWLFEFIGRAPGPGYLSRRNQPRHGADFVQPGIRDRAAARLPAAGQDRRLTNVITPRA
jgi:hypothetical protein